MTERYGRVYKSVHFIIIKYYSILPPDLLYEILGTIVTPSFSSKCNDCYYYYHMSNSLLLYMKCTLKAYSRFYFLH